MTPQAYIKEQSAKKKSALADKSWKVISADEEQLLYSCHPLQTSAFKNRKEKIEKVHH